MPNRWLTILIVVFWAVTTLQLIRREVVPNWGYGAVDNRSVLSERLVQAGTRWSLRLTDGRAVGRVFRTFWKDPDGNFLMETNTYLDAGVLGEQFGGLWGDLFGDVREVYVESIFLIRPLGRLGKSWTTLKLLGTDVKMNLDGVVEGRELVLRPRIEGLDAISWAFDDEVRIPIDPESLVMDSFGALDRIPHLAVGQRWSTRTIDVMASFRAGRPTTKLVPSVVTGIETIDWAGETVKSFVVEQRIAGSTVRSWARVGDGQFVRQQVPFQGLSLVMELER